MTRPKIRQPMILGRGQSHVGAFVLKELTKADWLGILNLPEARIPKVVILRGTRNFHTQYNAMRLHFENVLEVGTPNGIIEDVLIGEVRGHDIGFACVYGGT